MAPPIAPAKNTKMAWEKFNLFFYHEVPCALHFSFLLPPTVHEISQESGAGGCFRPPLQRLTRRLQCIRQRLTRQFLNNRLNRPTQTEGNFAGQRNRAALDVHAAIPLLKSPVRIQPPQKAVTCVRRLHLFLGVPASSTSETRVVYDRHSHRALPNDRKCTSCSVSITTVMIFFFNSRKKIRKSLPLREISLDSITSGL